MVDRHIRNPENAIFRFLNTGHKYIVLVVKLLVTLLVAIPL